MSKNEPKNEISVTIRFPKELHELIASEAEREMRSFNSQVIFFLRRLLQEQ
ncbi:MAG: Arc family DNA-binding protein [Candidatus Xenobiia bacterium LiM19]